MQVYLRLPSFIASPTTLFKHQLTSSRAICPTRRKCLRNNVSDLRNMTPRAAEPSQNEISANLSVGRKAQRENLKDDNDSNNMRSGDSGDVDDDDDEAAFIVNVDDDDYENENDDDIQSFQLNQRDMSDDTRMCFQSPYDVEENGTSEIITDDEIAEDDEEDDDFLLDGVTVVDVTAPQRRKKQRRCMTELLDAISYESAPETAMTADANTIPDLADDESVEHVRTAVSAADKRKGEDILAIRVSKLTYVTSFIVIITGNNPPQLRAISNLIEDDLTKNHSLKPKRVEGVPNSGWILLDFGDILINVFSREQRESYNLEKLWQRGEVLDISDCLIGPDTTPRKEITENTLDDWLAEE